MMVTGRVLLGVCLSTCCGAEPAVSADAGDYDVSCGHGTLCGIGVGVDGEPSARLVVMHLLEVQRVNVFREVEVTLRVLLHPLAHRHLPMRKSPRVGL
ncbi:hypothetical protein TcBrA4_0049310 [Trypanosoma cruzi]|nr:hypothetical protein TcBrA4_0049310 [Trypanosoma cruzi]